MSLIIALSIDYGLFLLSRWKEETERESDAEGFANQRSIDDCKPKNEKLRYDTWRKACRMWGASGWTIIGSGSCLLLSFVALACFPVSLLSSVGIGCLVAVLVMMFVNLTLQPAMLFAFPNFFSTNDCMNSLMTSISKCFHCCKSKKDATSWWAVILRLATSKVCAVIAIAITLVGIACGVYGMTTFRENTATNILMPRASENG